MSLDIGTLVGYLDIDSGKFDKVLDGLPASLKGKLGKATIGAGIVGAGIAAALGAGLANAIDLQSANAKLSAQLNLTPAESAKYGKIAGALFASNYGDSVEEVNDAIGTVVSSIKGMDTANAATVQSMTGKLMSLSKTFDLDIGRVSQVVGQTLKTGLAKDANEAADLVAGALQRVPSNVREDILDAADEYGPFFKQIGMSGEQAFGLLVEGSKKGMYGIDKAGDAIKEFTIRATDLGDKGAQQSLEELGFSGEDMANKLLKGGKSAQSATGQIAKALLGVKDPGQQANLALGLFGTQLEDLNKGQISEFLGSLSGAGSAMDGFGGSADAVDKKLNSGLANSMESVQRKLLGAATDIMGKVLPALSAFADFAAQNTDVIVAIAVVLGVLSAALIVLSVASTVAAAAELAVLWPILLIAAAIAALIVVIYLLVTHWGEIVGFLQGIWGGFVDWFTGLMDAFFGWWNDLWAGFGAGIAAAWGAVAAWFQGLPGAILGFFAGIPQWLTTSGRDLLVGLIVGILVGYVRVGQFFASLPGRILAFLVGAAVWLVASGRNALNGMANGIVSGAVAVWTFFGGLPGRVKAFLAGAAAWLVTNGRQALDGLKSGIVSGYIGVGTWMGSIPGKIKSALGSLGSLLVSAGGDVIRGLVSGISGSIGSVTSIVGDIAGRVKSGFKNALGIASPSKVFRGFGKNIGQGLFLGLDDIKPDVDLGVQRLTNLTPSTVSNNSTRTAEEFNVIIQGNVGWDPEEVVAEAVKVKRRAAVLTGLDSVKVTI